MKYVVVCGGVVSGLGKGTIISSIGVLLRDAGVRVTAIKIDPYLNVDAGTMSPFEHGEVFVLNDGGETDLDLGNYERFMGIELTANHNLTTGKVYQEVLARERRGDFLGKTVQVVPHVCDTIQTWLERVAQVPVDGGNEEPEVCLVEVGGTVGDLESAQFLEALRQLQMRLPPSDFCMCHVSLVPSINAEQKTKPTQHGVMELRRLGLPLDLLFCRTGGHALDPAARDKLALFCQTPADHVLSVHDAQTVYHVPPLLAEQGVLQLLQRKLQLPLPLPLPLPQQPQGGHAPLLDWRAMVQRVEACQTEDKPVVRIAVVGKYMGSHDAYFSIAKALRHAAVAGGHRLEIVWINAEDLLEGDGPHAHARLSECHGVLVPGGFGDRGVEGKVAAVRYARETRTPFLGVCLGFQCAVIEHCRHALGWAEANSAEFATVAPASEVVTLLPDSGTAVLGGTMRLGRHRTKLQDGSLAAALYGATEIDARHRHRYEVAPHVVEAVAHGGAAQHMRFTGFDAHDPRRAHCLEMCREAHPYFLGTQFHPEYTSTMFRPSPPFLGLLVASAAVSVNRESGCPVRGETHAIRFARAIEMQNINSGSQNNSN